mmetsp:Transcript_6207/g.10834  ORF Transcript_6207/g.10834 Transcript_6207/m.10834 type:complete len:117 (-) Transcript_6207:482-832(-)
MRRMVVPHIAEQAGAGGHALLEGLREALQPPLRHAQGRQAGQRQRDLGPDALQRPGCGRLLALAWLGWLMRISSSAPRLAGSLVSRPACRSASASGSSRAWTGGACRLPSNHSSIA